MKFDYLLLEEGFRKKNLEERLKELGLQGWEAVNMSVTRENIFLVLLKKEIH